MVTTVNGNILDCKESIICHQVNCQGVMGAGLAKQIRERYPEVFKQYRDICYKSGKNMLGFIQAVKVFDQRILRARTIINLFGQENYGSGTQTDYSALQNCFWSVKLQYPETPIAIPYNIGCGLAGGRWEIVYEIIEHTFRDYHDTVVIYKL